VQFGTEGVMYGAGCQILMSKKYMPKFNRILHVKNRQKFTLMVRLLLI